MSDNINNYAVTDTAPPSKPLTREEQYLSAIAGVTPSTEIPPVPITRVEKYLNKIVENGGGGGGTSDYTDLSNKPQINGQTVVGNKAASELGLQPFINGNNKLNSDDVSDVNSTNKFATAAQLQQISTNETNILSLQQKTVGMDAGGSNYISVNGHKIFVDSSTPTGASTGDLWFGV